MTSEGCSCQALAQALSMQLRACTCTGTLCARLCDELPCGVALEGGALPGAGPPQHNGAPAGGDLHQRPHAPGWLPVQGGTAGALLMRWISGCFCHAASCLAARWGQVRGWTPSAPRSPRGERSASEAPYSWLALYARRSSRRSCGDSQDLARGETCIESLPGWLLAQEGPAGAAVAAARGHSVPDLLNHVGAGPAMHGCKAAASTRLLCSRCHRARLACTSCLRCAAPGKPSSTCNT